jgi:hypothetical protein
MPQLRHNADSLQRTSYSDSASVWEYFLPYGQKPSFQAGSISGVVISQSGQPRAVLSDIAAEIGMIYIYVTFNALAFNVSNADFVKVDSVRPIPS